MKSGLDCVRAYVNNIFDCIEDPEENARPIYIHTVSLNAARSAAKRGLDMELATVIGLLHDIYSYKTGVVALHAFNGAEMVRVAFKYELAGLFSNEEQIIIKSALYHHSDKEHVQDEYDELLKDSDILQHLSFDTAYGRIYGQRPRRAMRELSIPMPNVTFLPKEKATVKEFERCHVADIAESLAEKKNRRRKLDADYMKIARYFPEKPLLMN